MIDYNVDNNNLIFQNAVRKLKLRRANAELSEKLTHSKGNISSYLNNKKPVSDEFLKKFFEAYNINLEDFKDVESELTTAKINYDMVGVPIYDVGFTAGFSEIFKDGKPILLGYLNIPEVLGSDMVVRVNGNSMLGVLDDGDWVGLKKVTDMEVISYGSPYGIVTQDLQLLKFLHKSNVKENLLLKSKNLEHPEFDLPIKKILELYIIKSVLKIKTFI